MAQKIHLLDPTCANQIAAGEVVERPASVVKELIENALDAGARRIDIELDEGGFNKIRVSDDGEGMSAEDARMSVERHATSKVRTLDDLYSLHTFGFRGEALPSIASVSKMTISTKRNKDEAGTKLVVEGGQRITAAPVGRPTGTTVDVRDLFFNTPARKKFMKTVATERAHVLEACLRFALSHPEVHIQLSIDGRIVRDFLPERERYSRAKHVLAKERLTVISGAREGVHLEAFLTAPEEARSHAADLYLFVNGRSVRDRALARAVAFGYGSVLPPGRYPSGVLYVELDPKEVDVNVHPQKAEVRFMDARRVYESVTRELAVHLGASPWTRPGTTWGQSAQPNRTVAPQPMFAAEEQSGAVAGFQSGLLGFISDSQNSASAASPTQDALAETSRGFFSSLRVLAQSQRLFLVCEGPDALYVIDQHAADERVRFATFSAAYHARKVTKQSLLFPSNIVCSAKDVALIETEQSTLDALGFDISALSENSVSVRAVPQIVGHADPSILVRDLLAELSRSGTRAFGDRVDTVLATMACHAAVRAGDALSIEQGTSILKRLDDVNDFSGHCPHGRPILFQITYSDLERKLGR